MTAPAVPRPSDEADRLAALQSLDVLDTASEPEFEEIVEIAAAAFEVDIALVSLVDAERQWFKARTGLEICQTERSVAFCAHAIEKREPLVVLNASLDKRFAANPLVTGEPYLRFYAGAPLILPGGQAIGTLCLMDPEPRFRFPPERIQLLSFMAGVTVERLVARAKRRRASRGA